MKRYISKRLLPDALYYTVLALHHAGEIRAVQRTINKFNFNIDTDGVFGPGTLHALASLCQSDTAIDLFLKELGDTIADKHTDKVIEQPNAGYEIVMNFLARWEGTVIHYNRGEKSFTTAYGVYKHAWPKAKPVKYVEKLGKHYGVNVNTRVGAKQINHLMTKAEKKKLKDLCYTFYMKNFVNKKVDAHFESNKMFKSKLTFFSNAVNGGMGRANRGLQSAIGVGVDGKVGNGTLGKLKKFKDDVILNNGMINYMHHFYDGLVRRNPSKFKRFINGWNNRLKALV